MKKIGIVTIVSGLNLGNSLQNYALQIILNMLNCTAYTIIRNDCYAHFDQTIKVLLKHNCFKRIIGLITNIKGYRTSVIENDKKKKYYRSFDKYIKFFVVQNYKISNLKKVLDSFDYFIVGSDQVWNPLWNVNDKDFLLFATKSKRIAYAASFGISYIPIKQIEQYKFWLSEMNFISVRESAGAEIIKNLIGKNVPVLLDPTLLLGVDEWRKVIKQPDFNVPKRYLLLYFLGERSTKLNLIINTIAQENDFEIIDILDISKDYYYKIGPSEFIYLVQNADLIYTDSFHGAVFSIIMNKVFVVVDRSKKNICDMSSRIDSLLSKFNLENRRGTIENNYCKDNLFEINYDNIDEILEEEKKKSINYLKTALNIK